MKNQHNNLHNVDCKRNKAIKAAKNENSSYFILS